jgi:aspartate 1-decarboxylase
MNRQMLRCKIHRATVTQTELHYEGSLTLDGDLMEAAVLAPYERIEIYNVNRGTRFATYVIPGPAGGGDCCVNGAAAHLAEVGDEVILCCYAQVPDEEVAGHRPTVVQVDGANRVIAVKSAERAGRLHGVPRGLA